MKCSEIMDMLFSLADDHDFSKTCDTCKAGDPEKGAHKVAVTMFATPNVIRAAHRWGADLLIVHEPVYNNMGDDFSENHQDQIKRDLIESTSMTIWRYHDHPHYTTPDLIAAGELRKLDLPATVEHTDIFDLVRLHLETPITPLELARHIETRCGIQKVRICGVTDVPCTQVSCMLGAPGSAIQEMDRKETQIVIVGEVWEWCDAQYANDAAELGQVKSLLLLGHIGSERDGMEYIADLLKEKLPSLDVRYFECGEPYTYTH